MECECEPEELTWYANLLRRNCKVMRIWATACWVTGALMLALIAYWPDDMVFTYSVNLFVGISMGMTAWMLSSLLSRVTSALRDGSKALKAAAYQQDLHEMRMEALELQEQRMEETVAALRREHEEERQKLQEIREEREAELKALGYLQGLKARPDIERYLNDPRERLRLIPPQDGSEASDWAS